MPNLGQTASRCFWVMMVLVATPSASTFGHEIPDGEIERRVQITVKPDRILVEYSVEMSRSTVHAQLRKSESDLESPASDPWKDYEAVLLRLLPQKMSVSLNGQSVTLEPVRASYTGWSHRKLTCLLRGDLKPSSHRNPISIIDKNFRDDPGCYRVAMKGRSGVKIENSNVPPLVSQAKDITLNHLGDRGKENAMRVTADLVIPASK